MKVNLAEVRFVQSVAGPRYAETAWHESSSWPVGRLEATVIQGPMPYVHLTHMATDYEYRGNGIASTHLSNLVAWSRERNVGGLALDHIVGFIARERDLFGDTRGHIAALLVQSGFTVDPDYIFWMQLI